MGKLLGGNKFGGKSSFDLKLNTDCHPTRHFWLEPFILHFARGWSIETQLIHADGMVDS